ncbi:MAG: MarR family transcriptional regulator [Chloracidobacterium sp.]|nr:MarR family transcriptional regulator [Chloracidobacterium sp.]
MAIETSVSYLLAKVGNAHRKLIEERAREIGLHAGQLFVLLELWKSDGLRQIDLANRLSVTAATVNKTIGGLIGNDYVTRLEFEDDARSTRICLTPKGRKVRAEVEAAWNKVEGQTLGGLTDAEETMLKQLLPKLLVEVI